MSAGFLVGVIGIFLISISYWNLEPIKSIGHNSIVFPALLGGLAGLAIAFLLMKTSRQNKELKANELKLRTLIDLSLDGIYLENEQGDILDCNTAGHEMFGYSREEMLRLNIRDLVPPEFSQQIPETIPDEMATGDFYLERENRKKDGSLFPTEINTKFVELNGKKRLIAYVRDNTKQKKSEAALKEVIATKNKLFSIIGHDLKGSLATIKGFSDLLLVDSSLSSDDTRNYLQYIQGAATQANTLLENLLNWALIQTDRVRFSPIQLSLKSIVAAVFSQIGDQANSKKIDLICNIDANSMVWADEAMLRTILRNLLANAIKYSYPDGQIKIEEEMQENKHVISIVDQGMGMTSDTIENLFKSCSRPKTIPGTNNEIGTGLGLIICKEFAEKHNGSIRVDSTPGKGTTFHIELPISQN